MFCNSTITDLFLFVFTQLILHYLIDISETKLLRKKLVFTDITMIFYYVVIEYLTAVDFEEKVPTLIYRQWLVFLYFIFYIFH